ncbi:MAG: gluconate 2-dehydrogenase subunit 3 family protein [Thermoanaerobaculia bacterium]
MRQPGSSRTRGASTLERLIPAAKSLAQRLYRVLKEGLDRWMGTRAHARRDPAHAGTEGRWLREDERQLLEILSSLIVPSDEGGPGAREAGVVEILELRLASSPSRQGLYTRGLPGFDRISRKRYGRPFSALAISQQLDLLHEIDRLSNVKTGSVSVARKALVKSLNLYRILRFPAVQLLPELIDDVMQTFYTSPVSAAWLGYDGPPMPRGYLDLERPRA